MWKKSSVKLSPQDPRIVEHLKAHCEDGWSVRMFSSKMQGGMRSYMAVRKINHEFNAICEFYRKPHANTSFYTRYAGIPVKRVKS